MKFLYPEFIYLMLIPAALLFYLISTNRDRLERVFSKEVLERLKIEGDSLGRNGHNTLSFVAFLFMTLALAQPVIEKGEKIVKSGGADLVIALDLSRSMKAADFYPDRLTFAKQKLKDILPKLPVGRIGIIGFTSASFIVAPLTQDRETLIFLLERLEPQTLSIEGTDISSALEGALRLLSKSDTKKLLLVTDGGDEKDMKRVEEILKKSEMELSVWMVASHRGAPVKVGEGKLLKDEDANVVVSRANTALKEPAINSGGIYVEATISDVDEREILEHFKKSREKEVYERVVHERIELFYYPLAIAVMILPFALFSFGARRGMSALLPFGALLFLGAPDLKAGIFDFTLIKKANEAYEAKDYKKSSELFEKLSRNSPGNEVWFDLAASYYKRGQYAKALSAYGKIVTGNKELEMAKLYGMANCYVKMGDLQKGVELYRRVLEMGEDEDAKANLELVLKLMKEKRRKRGEGGKGEDEESKERKGGESSSASSEKGVKPGMQKGSAKPRELSLSEERKWMHLIEKQPIKSKLYPLTPPQEDRNVKPW